MPRSNMETLLISSKHNLNNLVLLIDYNKIPEAHQN